METEPSFMDINMEESLKKGIETRLAKIKDQNLYEIMDMMYDLICVKSKKIDDLEGEVDQLKADAANRVDREYWEHFD
jgi:hypothetical protein